MSRQENQRRFQPAKAVSAIKEQYSNLKNKGWNYAWRISAAASLFLASCGPSPENSNQPETLPTNPNESPETNITPGIEIPTSTEIPSAPPLPIIGLNETELINEFPDAHQYLTESIQELEWVSGKSVELSALVFSPSNEPPEVVILANIDGFPHIALRRQQSEDGQIKTQIEMSPLFVSADEQGNVLYFTALEDEQGNPIANPLLKEITNSDGTQETWGFLTNGSIVKSPTDLSNPFTTRGKLASAIPMQNLIGIPKFDEALNTYTATNLEGNTVSWDGNEWQRLLPALPEWAQEYVTFHQGQQETINSIDYYVSQKTVQVGEETRQIAVKMVEYDQKAQEWIPCYDTVQELLDTRQLGSLHELNNITAPEEAVWIVRETWPESKEDLQKLEAMFHEFGVQIEAEVGHGAFWPTSYMDAVPVGYIFSLRCKSENCEFYKEEVDDFGLNEPKSWLALKFGDNKQVIIGMMLYEKPGLVWLGLDQAGFAYTDERISPKLRTPFNSAITYLTNRHNKYRIFGLGFETTDFLSATTESTTAWADVLDYYAQLPAEEQLFHHDAAASWTPFGRENPAWIEFMSGKINWLSSGMYAIEKEIIHSF